MSRNYTVGRSWECLLKHDRDHLRWTTIIIGVIRVRESDVQSPDRVKEISDQAAEMISGFRRSWLGVTRGRHLAGLVWRGVFELELKREIVPDGHHHATLESMGCNVSPLGDDERFLVVHTHFVVAFPKQTKGAESADELRRVIREVWSGRWQTQVKSLYDEKKQTVPEAITNLYSYSYKRRLQYSTGGLDDVPVKFGDGYGWLWSRFVLKVYEGFVFEFRSKR